LDELWLKKCSNDLISIGVQLDELKNLPRSVEYDRKLQDIMIRQFRLLENTLKQYLKDKKNFRNEKLWDMVSKVGESVPLLPQDMETLHGLREIRNDLIHGDYVPRYEEVEWLLNFLTQFCQEQFGIDAEMIQTKAEAELIQSKADKIYLPVFDKRTFVGREAELQTLRNLLIDKGSQPTVAILGEPGIGRSELALSFAHQTSQYFADGVVWHEAIGGDTDEVVRSLVRKLDETLGLKIGSQEAWFIWQKYISNKYLLVVIENADEMDFTRFRPIGQKCKTILTMQDRRIAEGELRLAQEAVIELGELGDDELVDLFQRLIYRGLDASDLPNIRSIVRILGGNPMAIRMTAGLLNDTPELSLDQFVGHLANAPLMHLGKIRRVFEMSLRHLGRLESEMPGLKNFFACLGACSPNGFSETVARAVGEGIVDKDDVPFCLGKLVSLYLLRRLPGCFKYKPLIREFARDLAKREGLLEGAERRQSQYFVKLVSAYQTRDFKSLSRSLPILKGEVEGLITTAEWLLVQPNADLLEWREFWRDIREIFLSLRHYDPAIHFLEMALELTRKHSSEGSPEFSSVPSGVQELEAYYAHQLGRLYTHAGLGKEGIEVIDYALKILDNAAIPQEERLERRRKYLNSKAIAQRIMRDFPAALETLREVKEQEDQSDESKVIVLNTYGRLLVANGKYSEGLANFEEALRIVEEKQPENFRSKAICLSEIGRVLRQRGSLSEALARFENSLRLTENIDDARNLSIVHNEIAETYCLIDKFLEAVTHAIKAFQYAQMLQNPKSRMICQRRFVKVLRRTTDYVKELIDNDKWADAFPLVDCWVVAERQIRNSRGEYWALINRGNVRGKLRHPREDRLGDYSEALENAKRRGDKRCMLIALQAKALLFGYLDFVHMDPKLQEETLTEFTHAELMGTEIGDAKQICQILVAKSRLLKAMGRNNLAKAVAESAAARLRSDPYVQKQMEFNEGDWERVETLTVGVLRRIKIFYGEKGYGFLFGEPPLEDRDIFFHRSIVYGETNQLRTNNLAIVDYYKKPDGRITANRVVTLE
jgi:tetratricopeptide (TPR) repeat protein/cold shock CspA family protein